MTRTLPLALLVLTGCLQEIEGGPEVSDTRSLEPFSAVRAESGVTVRYRPGAVNEVSIATQQKVLESLETVVKNDVLVVRLKPGVKVTSFEWTEVHVSGTDAVEFQARNGSTVEARELATGAVKVSVGEGGRVALSGQVDMLDLEAGEGSKVSATTGASIVSVDLTDGSSAEVEATERVSGSLRGGSKLKVTGGADFGGLSLRDGSSVE